MLVPCQRVENVMELEGDSHISSIRILGKRDRETGYPEKDARSSRSQHWLRLTRIPVRVLKI